MSYKPNHLKYVSDNSKNGFGVFSEMYYEKGWKATIDGKATEILNVNYVLRGLQIPTHPSIYQPVLKALEAEGIRFSEHWELLY
jgi:uncharacterized membrane protein YfhO